jgi:hypothetical protein
LSGSAFTSAMQGTQVTNGGLVAPGVIQVGREKWAVALDWYITGSVMASTGLARKAAGQSKGDFFVVKKPKMYAVGSSTLGHKRGMPSLALSILDYEDFSEKTFIGVFEIGNTGQFYYLILRDGLIDPTTDKIIDNGNEAEEEIFGKLRDEDTQWDYIYAPLDWSIDKAIESKDALEILVPKKTRKNGLLAVSRRREIVILASVLMLVVVGFGGYTAYNKIQEHEAQQLAMSRAAQMMAIQRAQAAANKLAYPPPSWTNKAHGTDVMKLCASEMMKLPDNPAGWVLRTSTCDGEHIVETFNNAGGTTNWIGPFVNHTEFGTPNIELLSPTTASVTWTIDEASLPKWSGHETGNDLGAVKTYLVSQFGEVFQPITLTPPIHPQVVATKNGKPVDTSAPWLQSNITFVSDDNPNAYDSILERLTSFIVASVQYDDSGKWTVVGQDFQYPGNASAPAGMAPPK